VEHLAELELEIVLNSVELVDATDILIGIGGADDVTMPFGRMRFRPRFSGPRRFSLGRRRGRVFRPMAHVTRNRNELSLTTVAASEQALSLVAGTETPADRIDDVPPGSVVRSIVVQARPQAITAGEYQFLLVYRPAAENVATPIASYWDGTDPLTEEGVKMRRLAMSRCKTIMVNTGDATPLLTIKWKGAKRIYDGDDISLWGHTGGADTTWNVQCWMTYTQ